MKNRHNKKRNTAFLYEILIKEATRAVVEKDADKKNNVAKIIRKCFNKNTKVYEELQLYKSLMNTTDMNEKMSEKLLSEVKMSRQKIDNKELFNEQTKIIGAINKIVGSSVYSNFIPNYKNMANIFQLFNPSSDAKARVMLEEVVLSSLRSKTVKEQEEMQTVDNLVFKTFVDKFNDVYKEQLSEHQQELVTNYVFSFSDRGVGIKSYLNEELGRLKKEINDSLALKEVKEDSEMVEKTNKVLIFLESLSEKQELTDLEIEKLLKIQMLAQEVSDNVN
jgi:hypothetical protein